MIGYILVAITLVSDIGIGLFVFFKSKQEKINKVFFWLTLLAGIWISSNFLENEPTLRNYGSWLLKIDFASAILLAYCFLFFCLNFPHYINLSFIKKSYLFCVPLIFSILSFTSLVINKINFYDSTIQFSQGLFYWPYALILITYIGAGCLTLILKLQKLKGIAKAQTLYVFWGLALSALVAIPINLLLTQITIISTEIYRIGIYGLLFFVIFTAYAIIKHHLMNIRVITTELLVGLVTITLLIDFISSDSASARIFKGIIFLIFAYLGISLIKSVLLEIKRREETEEIAKKLEEAYKKLQILDKAKTEFISMASHQLRTPLSTIKGYVSMLLEGSYGKLTKKTREKLINVSISNDRLVGIVNDLLNISKIELGKMEVDKKIIQIEEIITSVYEEMLLRAEEKNLQLLWNKPIKPLPKIAVDEPKIRQVISNIVDNALKYTNKGKIEINAQAAGPMIRIRISDTGVGLSPEEINVIFSGFMRGWAGINLFVEGSGLGLYIARKYIELHHGKIWADSKGKGLGSTFYIEIPITLNIDAEE